MSYTFNSLIVELGKGRIQRAINEQREWIPKSWNAIGELFLEAWMAVRQNNMLLGMAGFKSYTDNYLFRAYWLGKLECIGIE